MRSAKQFAICTLALLLVTGCTKQKGQDVSGVSAEHQHGTTLAAPSESTKTSSTAEPAKKEYTCPMHPQIKADHPGQCPICGMTLVPIDQLDEPETTGAQENAAPAPEGHSPFTLSEQRQQMIGVQFGMAEKKPLFKEVHSAGRLAFDPELYAAQSEYVEAVRQLQRTRESPLAEVKESAQNMLDSAKLRLRVLGLSDQQIEQLGRGGKKDSNLLLPKAGENVWVYAEIFEMDLPYVHEGLSVEINSGLLPGEKLAGKIAAVDRVLNPTTRTAKARISITRIKNLRPESFVDVTIFSPMGEQVVVPFNAVLDTGKEAWVFVSDGKGRFEPRLVTIKFHVGDEVAIGKGLEGGERIVTSANFLIDSESRLKNAMVTVKEDTAGGKAATPECPKGQHWDGGMKMCMPDIGG